MGRRAACLAGVLDAFVAPLHPDLPASAESATAAVRRITELHPVTYRTKDGAQ